MSRRIEFFFDVVSPYSYLAATQIDALAAKHDARVEWLPFFLGGVMQATGNKPPASLPARGPYLFRDVQRWSTKYGVPLRFPKVFPANTLKAQRMLTAIPTQDPAAVAKLALGFFALYWAEGGDPNDDATLVARADALGFDGASLLASASQDVTKAILKERTDEAVRRGAFGAPTMFFDGEMYFGNDRLVLLEDALVASASRGT